MRGGGAETQRGSSRLRASLGGNHEHIACGVCTAAINQGHRVVRLPCGDGNHVLHARSVLVAVRSAGARRWIQAPFVCSERGCGARHGRREALEAAVQADPGLRDAAVALTGRPREDNERHRQGFYCPWDQDSFGGRRSLKQSVLDRPLNTVHRRRQSQAESGNYSLP